jgi:predicted RNase H-like HicB family nuclease
MLKKYGMTTYNFPAIVEADEDRWFAYCPPLLEQGGSTWGYTRQEALRNLEEVVRLVVESLIAHGDPVPKTDAGSAKVAEPHVAVTV